MLKAVEPVIEIIALTACPAFIWIKNRVTEPANVTVSWMPSVFGSDMTENGQ